MKTKVIIILCLIIFICTFVIPGINFIISRTSQKTKQYSKNLKLEEEIDSITKNISRYAYNVQTFDPESEYDKIFIANRKAYENNKKAAQKYVEYANKFNRATSGKGYQLYILADKLMLVGKYDRALDALLNALKLEPDNQILKLKIYQKLALIGMVNKNEKTFLKALLRYIETCESLDFDKETKKEILKIKAEIQAKI